MTTPKNKKRVEDYDSLEEFLDGEYVPKSDILRVVEAQIDRLRKEELTAETLEDRRESRSAIGALMILKEDLGI